MTKHQFNIATGWNDMPYIEGTRQGLIALQQAINKLISSSNDQGLICLVEDEARRKYYEDNSLCDVSIRMLTEKEWNGE